MGDRITFERSTNARPVDRVARVYPHRPTSAKHVPRFGSRMANALLLLELGEHRKLSSVWDAEWYQGEFLSRLLTHLFAAPDVSPGAHNPLKWDAHLYQYETIDLEALLFLSRRQYRDILLSVLRSFYDEEGLSGPITDTVRRQFRLPRSGLMG